MQEIKQIENAVGQLKKEVWYIARVTIPKLKKEIEGISAPDLSGINATLSSHSSKLAGLEKTLDNVNSDLFACEENVKACQQNIAGFQAKIGQCEQGISSLSGQLSSLSSDIAQTQSDIAQAQSDIQGLKSRLSSCEEICSGYNADKSALETWKSGIESRLAALETEGGSSFVEKLDVIYDNKSEDPEINRGFTNGMVGGDAISFNFSKYRKVRFYATMEKNDAIAECYIANRRNNEVCLHTINLGLNKMMYLKVNFTAAADKLTVNYAGWYLTDTSTGEITFTRDRGNVNYFIYRIEGVY